MLRHPLIYWCFAGPVLPILTKFTSARELSICSYFWHLQFRSETTSNHSVLSQTEIAVWVIINFSKMLQNLYIFDCDLQISPNHCPHWCLCPLHTISIFFYYDFLQLSNPDIYSLLCSLLSTASYPALIHILLVVGRFYTFIVPPSLILST